jgi:hypothetical protein
LEEQEMKISNSAYTAEFKKLAVMFQ